MESILLRSPWIRAFLPLVLMGAASVSASSLVVEISSGNGILWGLMPQKLSFYILLVTTFLLTFYQISISKHDRDLEKGFTPKQYEAVIRNKVAEHIKALSSLSHSRALNN